METVFFMIFFVMLYFYDSDKFKFIGPIAIILFSLYMLYSYFFNSSEEYLEVGDVAKKVPYGLDSNTGLYTNHAYLLESISGKNKLNYNIDCLGKLLDNCHIIPEKQLFNLSFNMMNIIQGFFSDLSPDIYFNIYGMENNITNLNERITNIENSNNLYNSLSTKKSEKFFEKYFGWKNCSNIRIDKYFERPTFKNFTNPLDLILKDIVSIGKYHFDQTEFKNFYSRFDYCITFADLKSDKVDLYVIYSDKNEIYENMQTQQFIINNIINEIEQLKNNKKGETKGETKNETKDETKNETKDETKDETKNETKDETKNETKNEKGDETKNETKDETKNETKDETKNETKNETEDETKNETKDATENETKDETKN
jgi:hypothetical protein